MKTGSPEPIWKAHIPLPLGDFPVEKRYSESKTVIEVKGNFIINTSLLFLYYLHVSEDASLFLNIFIYKFACYYTHVGLYLG